MKPLVRPMVLRLLPSVIVSICALQLAGTTAAQPFEPQLPDPGNVSLSRQQQEQIGFKTAEQVYQQMPVLPDSSPETQYIRQIGQRLAAVIPPDHSWPFVFHVVAEKDINAFALPGGEMFVNLGAITAASNEAELAGVMAHEMSHVYMQHSAKQMQKSQMMQGLAGLAGAILGSGGGVLGSLGAEGIQIGAGMVMLKYSRGDEAQADAVGAMILYRAGYNPQALADFFRKLEAQGGNGPQFLSDHPDPGNRDEAILREIRNWPPIQYRRDDAEFQRARAVAAKAPAYSADEIAQGAKTGRWVTLNKRNGAVLMPQTGVPVSQNEQPQAGGSPGGSSYRPVAWSAVAPATSYTYTDLGLLKMVRPVNWQVVAAQQQGQFITVAPQAGMVDGGIGYGVMVNSVVPNSQTSLDETTQQIAQNLQSGQSGLQPQGSITDIGVGSTRGRSLTLQSTSPFPDANGHAQAERDWLVTASRPDGSVVYMVFVAPAAQFERMRPAFSRMIHSVQF